MTKRFGAAGLAVWLAAGLLRAAEGDWTLVWSDEFDKPGRPDPAKWGYEKGRVRNRELQYYTVDRPENARVEGGHLVIEGRRESYSNATFTAASLITKGKAAWTFGRIEVRAKLPSARGTWPAIWMLGANRRGWPSCGEIDIMEFVGHEPGKIFGNLHTGRFNHAKGTGRGGSTMAPDASREFHVYGLEWSANRIDLSVDGKVYFTCGKKPGDDIEAWPFEEPYYLLLNLAIGGTWGGQQGVDEAAFPQKFLVDYVRVYQRKPAP